MCIFFKNLHIFLRKRFQKSKATDCRCLYLNIQSSPSNFFSTKLNSFILMAARSKEAVSTSKFVFCKKSERCLNL